MIHKEKNPEKKSKKEYKTERIIISKGRKSTEVVYKTQIATRKGKPVYSSFTKHEYHNGR